MTLDDESAPLNRTVIPVRLAKHEGERLISRALAKRLGHRFERFRDVGLDFTAVEEIGQTFADGILRVFAANHLDIHLVPENTATEVARMIRRVKASARQPN